MGARTTHSLPLCTAFTLGLHQINLKPGAFVLKKNHGKENCIYRCLSSDNSIQYEKRIKEELPRLGSRDAPTLPRHARGLSVCHRVCSGSGAAVPAGLVGSGRPASFACGTPRTRHPPWLARRDGRCRSRLHPRRWCPCLERGNEAEQR